MEVPFFCSFCRLVWDPRTTQLDRVSECDNQDWQYVWLALVSICVAPVSKRAVASISFNSSCAFSGVSWLLILSATFHSIVVFGGRNASQSECSYSGSNNFAVECSPHAPHRPGVDLSLEVSTEQRFRCRISFQGRGACFSSFTVSLFMDLARVDVSNLEWLLMHGVSIKEFSVY